MTHIAAATPSIHSDTEILADRKVQRFVLGIILQRDGGTR
jgi:hypothetical protein